MKIVVIGASGFVGKNLCDALIKNKQNDIVCLSKNGINETENLRSIIGTFEDQELINKLLYKADLVYHLVSGSIPSSSWDNPWIEIEGNLIPTLHLIESCAAHHVKKIVFVSSAGTVYGKSDQMLDENATTAPFSPYGIIKNTIENFLRFAFEKYQIHYDIFRVSNIYGEGQNIKKGLGIINIVLDKILNNEEIQIFGDGKNVKNYIYIQDVVYFLQDVVNRNLDDNQIYNLSSDQYASILDIIQLAEKISSAKARINFIESKKSDNQFIQLDHSKLMQAYPEFSFTSLEAGMQKTWEVLLENGK